MQQAASYAAGAPCACGGHQPGPGAGAPAARADSGFDVLFTCASDGVLLLAPDGSVRRANAAAGQLLGGQPCLCGAKVVRALAAPHDHRVEALIRQCLRDGWSSGTVTALRADGTPLELQVQASSYRGDDGEPLTMVLLRPAENCGSCSRSAAGGLQLPPSVAHDLRSPIGTLAGFAKALERALGEQAPQRSHHYVQRILAAVGQLEDQVEALLSFAQIAHAPLLPRRVDLSATAQRILRDLQLRELDRIVSVRVQDGICAEGDPDLLRIVLENLLGNAWKFTGRCAEASIAFTAETTPEGGVVYQVRDNGAGFDMAYAGKLFRDFQRLHSRAEFPGTGIGLASVQRILERHGGRVWAESAPGQGATFWFTVGACGAAGRPTHRQGLEPALRDEVSA